MKTELNGTWKWYLAIMQAFITILLAIIIAGGWRFVDTSESNDREHDKRLRDVETISYNLGQAVLRYDEDRRNASAWQVEHQKEFNDFKDMTQKQFLELWRCVPRGTKIPQQ